MGFNHLFFPSFLRAVVADATRSYRRQNGISENTLKFSWTVAEFRGVLFWSVAIISLCASASDELCEFLRKNITLAVSRL